MPKQAFDPDAYIAASESSSSAKATAAKGFDPDAYIEKSAKAATPQRLEKSSSRPILETLGNAFRTVDSYTGAPLRAGMQAFQRGESLSDVGKAAKSQFGENPDLAPTGEDILANAGVPRDFTIQLPNGGVPREFQTPDLKNVKKEVSINPAAIGGFALESVTDPINYIPVGPLAKGAVKATEKAAEVVASPLANSFRKFAEQRAVKATTGESISALRKLTKTTLQDAGDIEKAERAISRVGSDVLDEGSIKALSTVEDIAPRLSESRKKYGAMIGEVGAQVDKINPKSVDAKKIADKITDFANSIPGTSAGKRLQEKLIDEAANFETLGKMSFEDAQKFKNQFKFKPQDADALISNQDATNSIKRIISKEMDDAVEKVGGKELAEKYATAKSKYDAFKSSSSAATDRVQKNLSNRFISPSDYGVGIGTGFLSSVGSEGSEESKIKNIAIGALGAMGHKFLRTRGSSLSAVTANSISNTLKKSPDFVKKYGEVIAGAASKGPVVLNSTHRYLMQNNPDYKKEIEKNTNESMRRRLGENDGKP
jgi:hypothetical protein